VAEDAMFAVPRSLREASYGLGAKQRTTSLRVVFPAAVSGIVAALILGISRAMGETMIVAIAAGGTGSSPFTINPLDHGQTMTAAMSSLAIGSDAVGGDPAAVPSLFFVGLLLFVITFTLNLIADRYVRRVRKTY
jgi:phosphate transport system permease protein